MSSRTGLFSLPTALASRNRRPGLVRSTATNASKEVFAMRGGINLRRWTFAMRDRSNLGRWTFVFPDWSYLATKEWSESVAADSRRILKSHVKWNACLAVDQILLNDGILWDLSKLAPNFGDTMDPLQLDLLRRRKWQSDGDQKREEHATEDELAFSGGLVCLSFIGELTRFDFWTLMTNYEKRFQ